MPKASPYEKLRAALLAAGAELLRAETVDTMRKSEIQFWNVPVPPPGRLVLVQVWEEGGWDAFVPIKEHRTDEAINEVLGKENA